MTTAGNTTTIALLILTLGILGWGYYRNRDLGKFGLLSWLQSAALMVPWLLSFGSLAAGWYINLAGVLFLLVVSTGAYIWLGAQVRLAAQDPEVAAKIAARAAKYQAKQPENAAATDAQPIAIEPEMLRIPDADLSSIKSIFGIDSFFATETLSYQQGAIFKGNMRGESASVRQKLAQKLKDKVGDRYRLFLVPDPEERPVVVVLPSTTDPQPASLVQKILAGVLFIATIGSSLEAVGAFLGFDFYEHTERVREVLPLGLGIWAILIAHELGHQVLGKMRGVKVGWPFFLPTGQIGSFGAITRFESIVPDRNALFDISIAGPAVGGLVSIGLLVAGLLLSHPGNGLEIPVQFLQGSILVGTVAKIVLGAAIGQDTISINPLVIIGWLGLVINALNLLPAGQLDGGRIVQAIYGRKTAQRSTIVTLIILAIVAVLNPANFVIFYWLILIGFLQRTLERPTLDDVTEPNDARAALGLLALFLMAATLIPFSPELAGKLGIGG